jgi:hypothetical protein
MENKPIRVPSNFKELGKKNKRSELLENILNKDFKENGEKGFEELIKDSVIYGINRGTGEVLK